MVNEVAVECGADPSGVSTGWGTFYYLFVVIILPQ